MLDQNSNQIQHVIDTFNPIKARSCSVAAIVSLLSYLLLQIMKAHTQPANYYSVKDLVGDNQLVRFATINH